MEARGRHWLRGPGRPPRATQRRPAGAGKQSHRGAGDRGGRERKRASIRRAEGEKEGDVESALGMGTPYQRPGGGGDSGSPSRRRAVWSLAAETASSPGSRQPLRGEGPSGCAFGFKFWSRFPSVRSLPLLVPSPKVRGEDYGQNWALFLGKGFDRDAFSERLQWSGRLQPCFEEAASGITWLF